MSTANQSNVCQKYCLSGFTGDCSAVFKKGFKFDGISVRTEQGALNCVEFLDQVLKDVIGSPELKEYVWGNIYPYLMVVAVVLTIFLIIAIIYVVNTIIVVCGHKSLYYYICPGGEKEKEDDGKKEDKTESMTINDENQSTPSSPLKNEDSNTAPLPLTNEDSSTTPLPKQTAVHGPAASVPMQTEHGKKLMQTLKQ